MVHLIATTKAYLTKESEDARGVITGAMCDKDGSDLQRGQEGREVYLDSMSGEYYMRVSHEEAKALRAHGDVEPAQGQGEVHGWFVPAPDFTVIGRLGERADYKGAARRGLVKPKDEKPAKRVDA